MKKVKFIKNFSLKSELAETIALCLIFYMVLACFALCIGLGLTSYFDTLESDKPSVISNMFVWSATLIAPVIVILLINSWKNQKNYDLKKEYASNILNDLHLNFIEILTHKEFVLILNGIDRRLKINKSYTSKPQHILGNVTLRSFSSFKIFGNLFNNDLLNLYTSLEKHCFQIDMAISSLRKFYIEYLETFEKNYKNDELINKDFFTSSYKFEDDYADFRSSITLINHQLKEHKVIEYDALTCEPVTIYGEYATLYEMLEATIDIIVKIQDLCIEALDLDNQ